jgi:hypothetical protein
MKKLGKAYGQSEEHVENLRNMLGSRLGLDVLSSNGLSGPKWT